MPIYQLKIQLDYTKPAIWRQVLVDSEMVFSDLHFVIQKVMGWDDAHLYSFRVGKGKSRISIQSRMDPMGYDMGSFYGDYEAEKIKISKLLINKKDKVIYEYDFGDSWEHTVTLEKVLEKNELSDPTHIPTCIAGERRCPPEDCGGVGGFYFLLEVLEDKKHPEHENMLEWMGGEEGEIEPWDYFSVEEADSNLAYLRPAKKKKHKAVNE